jgi:hypothetical protein
LQAVALLLSVPRVLGQETGVSIRSASDRWQKSFRLYGLKRAFLL